MSATRLNRFELLESRRLLAANVFQNPLFMTDVNNDGVTTPEDVVEVATSVILDAGGAAIDTVRSFLDTDGDQAITSGDIVNVASQLLLDARQSASHVDDAIRRLADRADSSLNDLFSYYRDNSETIQDVAERLISEGRNRIGDRVSQLINHFDDLAEQLRQQLDQALQAGLDQSHAALDLVRQEAAAGEGELDSAVAAVLEGYMGGERLRERLEAILADLQASNLATEIDSFVSDLENGVITVPESVTSLLEQLRDRAPSVPDELAALLQSFDARADEIRDGVVEFLNEFEANLQDRGQALPSSLADFRDALASGATPLRDFLNNWIDRLRGEVVDFQDLLDDVIGQLGAGQVNLPGWLGGFDWGAWRL